jgi:hypothetical protein
VVENLTTPFGVAGVADSDAGGDCCCGIAGTARRTLRSDAVMDLFMFCVASRS